MKRRSTVEEISLVLIRTSITPQDLSVKPSRGRAVESTLARDSRSEHCEAATEVKTLFGGKAVFDTPKPTKLIRANPLDSRRTRRATSSWTSSPVRAPPQTRLYGRTPEDGDNRSWILVQLPEEYPRPAKLRKAGLRRHREPSARACPSRSAKVAERGRPVGG